MPLTMGRHYRATPAGLIRNNDVHDLFERFLVSAAAALLGIRIYLAVANYPQLGGDGLHIAHMLWGGLLMLVALVLLLAFLGGRVRGAAAIIGGLGFGTFIDELGKFLTSDNDYFFRPTIAIIYAIFGVLYLVFQAISDRGSRSAAATLARALDATTTAALSGFSVQDRQRALRLLAETNRADPVVRSLQDGLLQVEARPDVGPILVPRIAANARDRYDRVIETNWFLAVVVVVMTVLAATGIGSVVLEIVRDPGFSAGDLSLSLGDFMKLGTDILTNVCIVIGFVAWHRSRLVAYEWFKRAVLVSLLLVQFFSFYEAELTAAWGLLFNLVLLAALNFAIRRERTLPEGARAETVPAG
ncbi:MAG: hypothetical protein H0V24_01505 [Chloroflexia bacterium]|nr:hypothetical protein [Chloroflexia bacterium]